MNKKMRVWWCPQIGVEKNFYIPVQSIEEAKKIMDILAAYDCYQYNQDIKPDFCNMGGLEVFNEELQEWEDWYYEDDTDYFDNVDDYCEGKSEKSEELKNFAEEVLSQVTFD